MSEFSGRKLFIVVYDDEEGLVVPMKQDEDCEGALTGWYPGDEVATFVSRKEARVAIRISAKFAQLQDLQGKAGNTDFTESRQYVKVVPLGLPKKTEP